MGFSGIGIWEILLIIVVALIVLGPSKIPEIARKLGQAVRAIRKASTELTTAVTREVESEKSTASAPETDVSRRDTESSTYPSATLRNYADALSGASLPSVSALLFVLSSIIQYSIF